MIKRSTLCVALLLTGIAGLMWFSLIAFIFAESGASRLIAEVGIDDAAQALSILILLCVMHTALASRTVAIARVESSKCVREPIPANKR